MRSSIARSFAAIFLSAMLVTRPTIANEPSTNASTATGDIHYHENFHSKILNNDRTVRVWLPPQYRLNPSRRFPVLYMHDGQNLFDDATSFHGEWHADETARDLIAADAIEPIIIVGIDNHGSERISEYTPTPDRLDDGTVAGGNGLNYEKFLTDEIKPFIDQAYRTQPDREHTAVAGSSLGGLISLDLVSHRPDLFSRCAAISPSIWWDDRAILHRFDQDMKWSAGQKIWLDIGTAEGTGDTMQKSVTNARDARDRFLKAGLKPGIDFQYVEAVGASHNEQAWSVRFGNVLKFLFPIQK